MHTLMFASVMIAVLAFVFLRKEPSASKNVVLISLLNLALLAMLQQHLTSEKSDDQLLVTIIDGILLSLVALYAVANKWHFKGRIRIGGTEFSIL